jgi:hypothetical protein
MFEQAIKPKMKDEPGMKGKYGKQWSESEGECVHYCSFRPFSSDAL